MSGHPLSPITYHVLLALADEERHGYGILKEIEAVTGGSLTLETGTLYAAIRRLRSEGLIESAALEPGADSRRKNYALTTEGRTALRNETRRLAQILLAARAKEVLRPS